MARRSGNLDLSGVFAAGPIRPAAASPGRPDPSGRYPTATQRCHACRRDFLAPYHASGGFLCAGCMARLTRPVALETK